jgi:hypothetical protein
MKKLFYPGLAGLAVWLAPFAVQAATTYSQVAGADTFVSSGEPNVIFGSRAAMEIAAPTASQPRTLMTLLGFDTTALRASFDADYGAGNWQITGVTLSLFSSVATAGQQPNNPSFNQIAAGGFEFGLLSNNSWNETAITWNTLPGILPGVNNNTLTSLGTFFWNADGSAASTWTLNVDPGLAQNIYNGEQVSLLGQPTGGSTVGYLFNTRSSEPGFLNVTAEAVPEPSTAALFACLTASCLFALRRRNKA